MVKIEDLYLKYKQDIFGYLMSLTHNHSLSEDLLSETFLHAIKSLPRFNGESTIKTWIFGIARNLWLQYLRNNKSYVEYKDLIEIYISENMEEKYIAQQTIERIYNLLKLKEERNQTIVKMRVNGFSYYEISLKLGISENSARVIDFRVKKWLKSILEKEGML